MRSTIAFLTYLRDSETRFLLQDKVKGSTPADLASRCQELGVALVRPPIAHEYAHRLRILLENGFIPHDAQGPIRSSLHDSIFSDATPAPSSSQASAD